MKETKGQTIQRLAADNKFLREKLSEMQAMLDHRDHLARKLIKEHNRPLSERRIAMNMAKAAAALRTDGKSVKAEF